MISVNWNGLGKRFNLRWVLKNHEGSISAGEHILIKGANGSGKSTFGKILVAATDATKGEITWSSSSGKISADELPQKIAWSAPFMEVPDDMTVREAVEFHSTFRKPWDDVDFLKMAEESGLHNHLDSLISELSSGLKQRLRLTLAMGSEAGMVVLDEPCSNLDENGIAWYGKVLKSLVEKATVVVCSNEKEFEFLPSARIIDLS